MRASWAEGALTVQDASAQDFHRLGGAIAAHLQDGDVLLLDGQLGAGKTSLAQAIAWGLGVEEDVVSPTFTIVCIYESGRVALNHFDLYRLEAPEELDDVDFWSLVDAGTPGASLIEWASLFAEDMPEDALSIQIYHPADGAPARDVRLTAAGERPCALLCAVAEEVC